jgi:hydrogenase maturation protein HypF
MAAAGDTRRRVRLRIEGTVQGVGFRPHVYRLASAMALGGYVRNDERGVLLEAEGDDEAIARFLARLHAEAPPLAEIQRVISEEVALCDEAGFRILASGREGEPSALVTPDAATCADCLAELFDPADRRYRYPFVNCTNCGPRFTIVRGVPYDRRLTTMAGFRMCAACHAEYEDPLDRRFHAQPNACPECGPTLRLGDAVGDDAVRAAAVALRDGEILAVKGVGGYHLACRADDEDAVAALRARKRREEKPFALMAPDLEAARSLVELGPADEALLLGRERPIVLAPRRAGARVAAAVAPRSSDLGVMLPYSPLHHLLLADLETVLVMTSGNVSDEPIAYEDAEARARLDPIADRFLTHDRPIHTRTDDSVVRARRRGAPLVLRRSRGYVPASLDLPLEAPPLVACGAELKATFCVAKRRRAWVGHHIGDLQNLETLMSFREGVAHFERLFAVAPEVVAHDLHPDYLSTRYALERDGVRSVAVQHHHAHLAACLAEHGETGPAVGAIYDGSGLGTDGTIWGGELLVGDLGSFERVGHLRLVRLPGGDRAVREPWRMACAWLAEALGDEPPLPPRIAGAVAPDRWDAVARMARSGLASPPTTSMGRLFDAVAALSGLCAAATYEGQAAAELEAVAGAGGRAAAAARAPADEYPFPVIVGPPTVLDAAPTVLALAADVAANVPATTVATRFHAAVAAATATACELVARRHTLDLAVLSGGVFQNRLLVDTTARALERRGLRVLVPERLPPNDGAISYGQAAVAAARTTG